MGVVALIGREPQQTSAFERMSLVLASPQENRSDLKWHVVQMSISCLTGGCRFI
jgi:hypothetical protein